LTEVLSGKRQPQPAKRKHALPDFATIHQELQKHSHLTLQLVWQEQRESHPEGYRYSRFCDLYRRWLRNREVVLRQEHRAGEKLFVDYAGATIPYLHPQTGEQSDAAIFVAVLGASSYTYAEATAGQDLNCWIGSHIRTFEFLDGVPQVVVPDNLRSGVTRTCRYEPDLNRTYQEMAAHYGVAVIPARPRKPRDKAKVEVGVQVVQRWIVAALRHRKFFSLTEVNQASRADVLIVDDWAMAPLSDTERRGFLEICDDRYQTRSTVLTSQLPVSSWHAQIGDPTIADSILDRLVHNAHRIELQGESMRKKRTGKAAAGVSE